MNIFARIAAGSARLRRLIRQGWISLVIGLTVLAAAYAAGRLVRARSARAQDVVKVLGEDLLIGGWVAPWRPMETWSTDWWPILGERRFLYDRLSRLPVRVVCTEAGTCRTFKCRRAGQLDVAAYRRNHLRGEPPLYVGKLYAGSSC